MELKDKLKSLRNQQGWTQGEVATRLGLKGHSTYSNWEYGRTQPDHETLKRLASLYNVTTDYLLGHTENPTEEVNKVDLYEALKDEKTTFEGKELSPEEHERILQMIRIMIKE